MGELFRRIEPDAPLDWTGERMVTGQTGAIEAEHYHRYFVARELCRSLDVLDVASGEGQGSAFLAQTARKVVGVEIDPQSVEHAISTYRSSNLRYIVGDAAKLPIDDRSVDAVISFETIEHLSDHRQFLAEVKRVLRPNGFLLISTPDVNAYSASGAESNSFHARELTEAEFRATLSASFRNVQLIRQRAMSGSVILPDATESVANPLAIFEQRDRLTYEAASHLLRATYLLALASDQALPAVGVSLFMQKHYAVEIAILRAELEQVRKQHVAELWEAGEKIHHQRSQRILLEEELARARRVLDEAQKQSSSALQSASELAHQEWNQRTQVERELSSVRSQLVEMQSQRIQMERGLANVRSQLGEVGKQLSARQSDLEAAKIERGAMIKKLAELRTEADYHRQQLHMAVNSGSWKITKPLRALNSVLRGRQRPAPEPTNSEAANPPERDAKDDDEGGVPFDRAAWDRHGHARLTKFLTSDKFLDFGACERPLLSVILVLFNKEHLTLLSLESVLANADVPYELILVDNASTAATGELLQRVRGVRVIVNAQNVGFGPACMQAAEVAQAPYLCFFNNDALLQPKALGMALENFTRSNRIGVVGGKILLADGSLQEAGSIVWSDGSAFGYGRSFDPSHPAYEFRRPVDYCSGAFLFTPRALFSQLGGFRDKFAPAYYEDTDYCLRVWQNGLQVIYEPRAVIRHYESASSEGNEKAQLQMAAKQSLFVGEWMQTLPRHLSPSTSNQLRARIAASSSGLRILYLDDRIPHRGLGSGFPRSNDVLQHLAAQGHQVACVALSFPLSMPKDEYDDIPREVELVDGTRDCVSVLKEYVPACDLIWVSRPHNMERCLRAIADSVTPSRIPIIYDAESIFSDSDRLKGQVEGHDISSHVLNARSAMEAALAQAADVTLAVSEGDARTLATLGARSVKVLGHCVEAVPTKQSYAERSGFLFLGAIHDEDSPNLDALRYFCREGWPTVSESTRAEFTIAGFETEKYADEFRMPGVRALGPQKDTRHLYQSARVFVVPTRYCAGLPYVAHEAAANGVPMVVTPIICDQLGWIDGQDCLVAADAKQFADGCIKLFSDASLWNTVRDNALRRVSSELNSGAFSTAIANIVCEVRYLMRDHQPTHMPPAIVSARSSEQDTRPLVDPVILHIHVPKCGGTAFRNFLQNHYGAAHRALYVSDRFSVYPEEELAEYLADRNVRCISTHFVRTFPQRLAGRDLLYITFVRNPIDQFISYITYIKKNFQDLRHDQPLMTCLPPDVPSLSIREIAHWILTHHAEINFHENFTVNFFSWYPLRDGPNGLDQAQYRKQRLATAQKILEDFLFVGLVEDMNRSVSVLRRRVEAANLPFPSGEVPFENFSLDFRGDLGWINSDDEVGRLLLDSVREDQQLYDWAQARLLEYSVSSW
ncbi:MAG TPA: methyltransferase domain-containing protein [Terriglobales bacterium]|nr:methyltransferase domain-containing protein [Terriglobales bacterium]